MKCRERIVEALLGCDGNVTLAAEALKMNPSSLRSWLWRHEVILEAFRWPSRIQLCEWRWCGFSDEQIAKKTHKKATSIRRRIYRMKALGIPVEPECNWSFPERDAGVDRKLYVVGALREVVVFSPGTPISFVPCVHEFVGTRAHWQITGLHRESGSKPATPRELSRLFLEIDTDAQKEAKRVGNLLILAGVHPRHSRLYTKFMNMGVIGEVSAWKFAGKDESGNFLPAVFLYLNYPFMDVSGVRRRWKKMAEG